MEVLLKIIYVAGPFRGPTPWDVECNIRQAEELALQVAKAGAVPLVPHTLYRFFDKSLPDEFWLDATSDLLRRCDAVLLGPRWAESSGARAEKALAEKIEIPVFDSFAALEGWIRMTKWTE